MEKVDKGSPYSFKEPEPPLVDVGNCTPVDAHSSMDTVSRTREILMEWHVSLCNMIA